MIILEKLAHGHPRCRLLLGGGNCVCYCVLAPELRPATPLLSPLRPGKLSHGTRWRQHLPRAALGIGFPRARARAPVERWESFHGQGLRRAPASGAWAAGPHTPTPCRELSAGDLHGHAHLPIHHQSPGRKGTRATSVGIATARTGQLARPTGSLPRAEPRVAGPRVRETRRPRQSTQSWPEAGRERSIPQCEGASASDCPRTDCLWYC